jgi:signal transduction histidine kinase
MTCRKCGPIASVCSRPLITSGNALKFTRPGGRITLGAALNEDEVQFWVADTGSGVAAEDLPHVFDRFWQGHKGERRGTGLGLTIVKGIIEAHGGRIRVESTLGMGTTFFFALPTADHTVGDTVRAAAVSPEVSPGSEELTATHELVR